MGTAQQIEETTEVATVDEAPPVEQNGSTSIIQVIERAALNPNVDIDKMERLLEMQERITARAAEQAFNEAMKAAQEEMPQVVRDAANSQTNSRYARLETVSAVMGPVVTRHGFSMSFGTDVSPMDNHYRITCTVAHIEGHSRTYHADVPADMTGMKGTKNKTATHGFGSTLSYGRRYLKLLIFDVATTDDDGNSADSGEVISEEQLQVVSDLADEVKADKIKFCRFLKIACLADLPTKRFGEAVKALKDFAAERSDS